MSGSKTVILHVGYGKTGSSALQSSFALSQDSLLQNGIHYPSSERTDAARQGQITSGNAPVTQIMDRYDQSVEEHPEATSVLLSNEGFFQHLMAEPGVLQQFADRGVSVQIILYVRDPLKHAISLYGQGIKRGGETGDLARSVLSYRMPLVVGQFLDVMEQAGARVSVLNYSRCQKDLLNSFAAAIDVAPEVLVAPPVENVNRSLTPSELYLQRCFNEFWGVSSSKFVSDVLCNELPDQKPDGKLFLSREDYDQFRAHIVPILEQQNARLPAHAAYRLEAYEDVFGENPVENTVYQFSPEQLRLLVRSVAGEFPSHAAVSAFGEFMGGVQPGYQLTREDVVALRKLRGALKPNRLPGAQPATAQNRGPRHNQRPGGPGRRQGGPLRRPGAHNRPAE